MGQGHSDTVNRSNPVDRKSYFREKKFQMKETPSAHEYFILPGYSSTDFKTHAIIFSSHLETSAGLFEIL